VELPDDKDDDEVVEDDEVLKINYTIYNIKYKKGPPRRTFFEKLKLQ
jgi:hypothetical protein